jgi:ribose-phosphate pyrophosphokinase
VIRVFGTHTLAIANKVRQGHGENAELVEIIGEVADRDAIVVDDFTISAGTLVEAAEQLVARGARSVTAVVTHGVFAEGSMERLDRSPIERVHHRLDRDTTRRALSKR